MEALRPTGAVVHERFAQSRLVAEQLDLGGRHPRLALRQQLPREHECEPARVELVCLGAPPASSQRTRASGIDQADLEATLLELAGNPPPAFPATHSPTRQGAHATARNGSRSTRPDQGRAPVPEKQSCEYRSLRTTFFRASLRDGRWAANVSRPGGPLHYIPDARLLG